MSTTLAAATLAAIVALSPPSAPVETFPGWAETPQQRLTRYHAIADDVAGAVEEMVAAPGACGTLEQCRARAVGLLLGIAWHESGFAPDVDAGQCYRGRDGRGPRCDSGRSHSMWQLRTGGEEAELFAHSRREAAKAALRKARRSLGACHRLPEDERLVAYAGGRCEYPHPVALRRAHELHAAVSRAWALVVREMARP